MLADSHCHLDWFSGPAAIVANAQKAGVEKILSNATSMASIGKNLALSSEFKEVKCALGIHPVDLLPMKRAEIDSAFRLVEENISSCVAIGEVGMDFKRASMPVQRELQEEVFRKFISLAITHDKPVVVHSRWAESQCLSILEEMGCQKVHMHWFTSSAKNARRAVRLGYRISCGPIILSDALSAQIVKGIPLESLLLETDAPVEFGGGRSEPSWIPRVCAAVSAIKGVSAGEVSQATGRNFSALYGLSNPAIFHGASGNETAR